MTLKELLSENGWNGLAHEMHEASGLCCSVADAGGAHVTTWKNWCNALCPAIKANPESLKTICAATAQNFTIECGRTGGPVIGECDAGMVKVAVPILFQGELLGTAGGCGCLAPDGEIEDFLIGKLTGLPEEEILRLADTVPRITEARARRFAEFVQGRVEHILACAVAG